MEVRYEVDKRDIVAFLRHGWRSSPSMRRVRNVWIVGFWGLVAFNFFFSLGHLEVRLFFLAFWAAAFALLSTVGLRLMHSFVANSMVSKRRENGVTGRHRVWMTPEKFVETTSVNETHSLWRGVDRVEQNDDYIYVFITPHSAAVVPKRAFLDARQAAEFYGAAVRFHAGARADVPRPTAAEIERAARLDGRPASQFDERHLSPVERVFSE